MPSEELLRHVLRVGSRGMRQIDAPGCPYAAVGRRGQGIPAEYIGVIQVKRSGTPNLRQDAQSCGGGSMRLPPPKRRWQPAPSSLAPVPV